MSVGEICLLTNDVTRLADFYKKLLDIHNNSTDSIHQTLIGEETMLTIYHDTYDGNESISYSFNNKELFETTMKIAKEDLGISPFEPKSIKNIKNANLTIAFSNKKSKMYKQTIVDPSILRKIEEFLSNAQIINGASACPFTEGLLKLTLEGGKEINLAMATDGCRVFCVNGRYFEYKTQRKPVKGDSIWYISILGDYFSDIPWEH